MGLLLVIPPALSVSADADLWWHIFGGREIVMTGALPALDHWSSVAVGRPWIDHEWAPEIALYLAHHYAGNIGLLCLRGLMLLVLMAAWLDVIMRRVRHDAFAWLLVGIPWVVLPILANLRPQTVTWALVPVVLALSDRLEMGKNWAAGMLVLLVWLWANLHGGFLFGWGLAGLALLLGALGYLPGAVTQKDKAIRWIGCVLIAISPAFGPYGLALPDYVLREITAHHPDLPEWNAPTGTMFAIECLCVAIPVVLHLLARIKPHKLVAVGLAIAALATLSAAKFIALVMLLSAVASAAPLGALLARLQSGEEGRSFLKAMDSPHIRSLVLLTMLVIQWPLRAGPAGTVPVHSDRLPFQAVAWLAGSDAKGVIALPLGWGGLAIYALYPDWRVTLDGRNTAVYSVSEVQRQTYAWQDGDASVILGLHPDVVLAPRDGPVNASLATIAGWNRVWQGEIATIWSRPGLRIHGIEHTQVLTEFPGVPITMTRSIAVR